MLLGFYLRSMPNCIAILPTFLLMERFIKHAKRSISTFSLAALSLNILLGSAVAALPVFSPQANAVGTTLLATAVGNYDQWSASAGSKVAAVGTNDAVFISEATNTERQSFTFASAGIPTGALVSSVVLNVLAKETGGSSASMKLFAEDGLTAGDRDVGSTNNLTSSYVNYTKTWNENPFTNNDWTAAEVNTWTVNFGVEKSSANADVANVTYMELVVNYTVPTCNALSATISGSGIINGTAGDDVIVGSSGVDTITGNGGNDTICALGGNDSVTTGNGNDWIDTGDGTNTVVANGGNNTVFGGSGNDNITTGNGNDTIDAGDGSNVIVAGAGVNMIDSGNGNDTITTGNDNDTIVAGDGSNVINAGSGTNSVTTGNGNDSITTGNNDDTIVAGAGSNTIVAGAGVNSVTTGNGNDDITTGNNDDTIIAGDGSNVIDAGSGENTVTTGNGNDDVTTGNGNDTIVLGNGTNGTAGDRIQSGAGNDSITGGSGNDHFDGGDGMDYCDPVGTGGNNTTINCEAVGDQALVTIVKDAQPDTADDFLFTGDIGAFALDDDADGTLPNSTTVTMAATVGGTVRSITESVATGWQLQSITCTPDAGTSGNVGSQTATVLLNKGDHITCTFVNTPAPVTTVRVTIAKYMNGVHATAGNTDNASFNMTAVYNASNIGSGSDPYVISATGNGTPEAYEAQTIALASGADYSTYETISAPCTDATPFELVGYSTGDSLAAAEAAPVSMTVPAFTGLTSDKFVIVWNETCPPVPTHLTPADGSTLTTAQLDKIDWSDVATPALPMTYFYEVATTDTSTNPDGSFVNPVYESAALSDSEIVTAGTGDGTYHWHVRAVDAAGNSSAWSAPWTVTVSNAAVDTTPPVVEILGYRNQTSGTYDSGPAIQACGTTTASSFIAFEWQEVGTDVSQPLSYEYKILSGPAGVGYTQVHSGTHHNGGIPAEGTYTIQITPTDAASNVGTPVTCTMTYDADYVAPVACNVSDIDLIAHWKLDEAASATVAEDATANNNDGAVMSATSAATPATTPVFINTGSYDFDGVNDSIDMGSNVGNFTVADSFSISAWINPALDFQNHAIYGNTWSSPGYLLRVTDQNKIRFILAENGSVYEGMDSGVLTPGWHHVTGVWDGANVKVYVDGVDASMTSIANGTVSTITTSAHTFIGQTGQIGSAHYFDGMIDDVRVYGDVLSESEIAALAAGQCQGGTPTPASSSSSSSVAASSEAASSEGQGSSAQSSTPEIVACTTTALAGYWPMNEGEGTTAFDMTGLGHDGTLQGGTAWASGANAITPNPFGLDFDGSDDIVNITSSNDFNYGTQEFTVSTFVRTTTGNRSILGNFSAGFKGWGLYVYNTNQVNFFGYGSMGNNDAAKPAIVLDGNWHNLTGVYRRSGNDLTIDTYVDGVLVGSNTAAVGDISANSTLYFGQYLPQPSLDGGLDDVRIYGRALSAGEVAAIAGGCSNPVIASSSSSSSSSASEGESSSESVESFQSFGLSTPEVEPGNGAFRGSRTNILAGVINFIKGKINITAPGSFGGVAPGGFGGASDLPYTIEEKNLICTMKRAIPTDAKLAIWEWVASTLSEQINHSADDILESLKDSTFCDYQATAKTKVAAAAKPLPFLVSAAGFPLSDNPTWNACVTGKVTLQDIRNNPDKDKHGRGLSCATYHTGNMWTHPDLKIFFTWNSKTKKITLPEGFAIEKQEVTL